MKKAKHEDGRSATLLFRLGKDPLVHVSSFLDHTTLVLNIALTCTSFAEFVRNDAVFHYKRGNDDEVNVDFAKWFQRAGPRVKSIHVGVLRAWHLAACPLLDSITYSQLAGSGDKAEDKLMEAMMKRSTVRPFGRIVGASVDPVRFLRWTANGMDIRVFHVPLTVMRSDEEADLTAMDLSSNSYTTDMDLGHVSAHLLHVLQLPRHLTALKMFNSYPGFSCADLHSFLIRQPGLKLHTLQLDGAFRDEECAHRLADLLAELCPGLTDLDVELHISCCCAKPLISLNKCTQLKKLGITCVSSLETVDLSYMTLDLLEFSSRFRTGLRGYVKLPARHLPRCPIQHLTIDNLNVFDDSDNTICASVQTLHLSQFLDGRPIQNLSLHFPSLTSLHVPNMDLSALNPYVAAASRLRTLECGYTRASDLSVHQELPVVWLHLVSDYCHRPRSVDSITTNAMDEQWTLKLVATYCPRLVGLEITVSHVDRHASAEQRRIRCATFANRLRAVAPLLVVDVSCLA
jgi:hypothetical protein